MSAESLVLGLEQEQKACPVLLLSSHWSSHPPLFSEHCVISCEIRYEAVSININPSNKCTATHKVMNSIIFTGHFHKSNISFINHFQRTGQRNLDSQIKICIMSNERCTLLPARCISVFDTTERGRRRLLLALVKINAMTSLQNNSPE